MHKYDFGYCLESNPTNKWAFEQIRENSRVLEMGPAFGVLTKHLQEEKNCVVDIVEFDVNAGEHAKAFANRAIVGDAGNLDDDVWYEQLRDERYDYVIALDVFEHLKNPLAVMQKAKTLLKDDGHAIISVPNLAHNAVIARLINNHFGYTDVGLLDNTHVHFFAYHELMALMQDAEMAVNSIEGILKPLDGTEIPASWGEMSLLQAIVLKDRIYGDVYQYLLVCSPKICDAPATACRNLLGDGRLEGDTLKADVVINGQVGQPVECLIRAHAADCEIDCSQFEAVEEVRIVFEPDGMLISGLEVCAEKDSESFPLRFNWTSGAAMSGKDVVFSGAKPCEINFAVTQKPDYIRVRFSHAWIDKAAAALMEKDLMTLVEQSDQVIELKESLRIIQHENQTAWEQFAQREAERNEELNKRLELEEAIRQLTAKCEELRRQLEASNTDRATAWAQFADRDAECNKELEKRLELEETTRKMTAESEELHRQLEASNTDRAAAWEQFAQRDAQRNEELSRRLELEEAIRRMVAESEELRRQLEASNADRTMAWERFVERDVERNEELNKRLELEEAIRQLTAECEELHRQLEASNADRAMAWEQFAQRDTERNEELSKRLELEEEARRMTAESEELRRQLEVSNTDRTAAWEQFAQRDAERNEELSKRLELEEEARRMTAESEELRRQLEHIDVDRRTAWTSFTEREQQLSEAVKERKELEQRINEVLEELDHGHMLLDRYNQRISIMNAKIHALEKSALVRMVEKLKKI